MRVCMYGYAPLCGCPVDAGLVDQMAGPCTGVLIFLCLCVGRGRRRSGCGTRGASGCGDVQGEGGRGTPTPSRCATSWTSSLYRNLARLPQEREGSSEDRCVGARHNPKQKINVRTMCMHRVLLRFLRILERAPGPDPQTQPRCLSMSVRACWRGCGLRSGAGPGEAAS